MSNTQIELKADKGWRKIVTRIGFYAGIVTTAIGFTYGVFTGNFRFNLPHLLLAAIMLALYVGFPYLLMVSARRNPRTWKAICSIAMMGLMAFALINMVRLS